jgi:heme-degrading monooxygenase HmoA
MCEARAKLAFGQDLTSTYLRQASIISSIAGYQHSYILELYKAYYPVATKWITTSEATAWIRKPDTSRADREGSTKSTPAFKKRL